MKVAMTLLRYPEADTCPGRLYVRNEVGETLRICATLEHPTRTPKVWGITGIPCGTYEVELRHSTKFGRKMPFLKAVPNFTGIMIHPGNSLHDTQGCILVGNSFGKHSLINSRREFNIIYDIMLNAETITIEIKNGKENEQCAR